MRIYLDHNATTPVRPEVAEAMSLVLREEFGNPSSVYEEGASARARVEAGRAQVAELLGVRMCPLCPRCNHRPEGGCQDMFGSNMRPMGGFLGAAVSLGGGNEYQQHTTPHLHVEVHLVCAYQYNTLMEIADAIKAKLVDPDSVKRFQQWLHKEDLPLPI